MVWRSSSPDQPTPFAEFAADIARRRGENPGLVVPRNAGHRRTESKKALLKAIKDAGGDW